MIMDFLQSLPNTVQTSFWTVQMLVNAYAAVQFMSWMGADDFEGANEERMELLIPDGAEYDIDESDETIVVQWRHDEEEEE